MVNVGTLVQYADRRWVICRSNELSKTITMRSWEGDTHTCADNDTDVVVICHPSTDWPFIAGPTRPKAGPVKALHVTRMTKRLELEPLIDWMPSEFLRPGGSIFFNPSVGLRVGEIVVATHEDGSGSRINVGHTFATVAQRVLRATTPKKEPKTAYDRLLGDELDET